MRAIPATAELSALPNHLQLPFKDDIPVDNILQPLLAHLLTGVLEPWLQKLFPGSKYFIGQDVGIYFEHTKPPMLGCRAPDWYLVTDVPRLLDGEFRRSFVMWQEMATPLLLLEFASGTGAEERDRTPRQGKFWIYEKKIRPPFYGIYVMKTGELEMHHLVEDRFERLTANAQGRYPIPQLGVELGVWHGVSQNYEADWLRFWTPQGEFLPTDAERAERMAAKLRLMGVDPDNV